MSYYRDEAKKNLWCSLIMVEIWAYNTTGTFEIWILHQPQLHRQESDFWKYERTKLTWN